MDKKEDSNDSSVIMPPMTGGRSDALNIFINGSATFLVENADSSCFTVRASVKAKMQYVASSQPRDGKLIEGAISAARRESLQLSCRGAE
jgi:hypothetical protein